MSVSFYRNHATFEENLSSVFKLQFQNEPVFRRFCEALRVEENELLNADTVPLLPVEAFRDATIGDSELAEITFKSSGTTGTKRSIHYVKSADIYRESISQGIRHFYPIDSFVILGYTPGYHENPNSSLIWMLQYLIEEDTSRMSRFLPLGKPISEKLISDIRNAHKRIMLFGAAFGLMDMAETFPIKLPADSIIMETGGMKTHRREMKRQDMHQKLADAFGLASENIHSEYGMTELLSQAYSDGSGWFRSPPWMRISIRNPENPMQALPDGEEGLIGIIDLANVHSCSFLLTGDKGVRDKDCFMVLGRYEPENLRGCNFLIDKD